MDSMSEILAQKYPDKRGLIDEAMKNNQLMEMLNGKFRDTGRMANSPGEYLDSVAGVPVRTGINELQQGNLNWDALKKTLTSPGTDPKNAPTGVDLAWNSGIRNPYLGAAAATAFDVGAQIPVGGLSNAAGVAEHIPMSGIVTKVGDESKLAKLASEHNLENHLVESDQLGNQLGTKFEQVGDTSQYNDRGTPTGISLEKHEAPNGLVRGVARDGDTGKPVYSLLMDKDNNVLHSTYDPKLQYPMNNRVQNELANMLTEHQNLDRDGHWDLSRKLSDAGPKQAPDIRFLPDERPQAEPDRLSQIWQDQKPDAKVIGDEQSSLRDVLNENRNINNLKDRYADDAQAHKMDFPDFKLFMSKIKGKNYSDAEMHELYRTEVTAAVEDGKDVYYGKNYLKNTQGIDVDAAAARGNSQRRAQIKPLTDELDPIRAKYYDNPASVTSDEAQRYQLLRSKYQELTQKGPRRNSNGYYPEIKDAEIKQFTPPTEPGEIQSTPGQVIGDKDTSLWATREEIRDKNSRADQFADLQQKSAIPENVEILHDADGIPVVKTTDPAHRSKIGIHLTDPTEHDIQDAIDVAHRDNFPAIYVHARPQPATVTELAPRLKNSSPSNAGSNRSENVSSLVEALKNKGRKK